MSFLWLAPFALALSVFIIGPVVAHLFRQPPVQKRHFGAMMLLLRLPRQLRRRRRFQDWLLLLLRLICILLFVFAAVQPVLRWPNADPNIDQVKRIVLILDDSLSMDHAVGTGLDGRRQTAFSTARSAIIEQIKTLPEGVELGLVTTASSAQVLTPELRSDRSEIMALVAERQQQYGDTDLVGAIQSARRILDGRGGAVFVYSDEAGLATVEDCQAELSLLASQNIALHPKVIRAENPGNISIISASYGEGVEGGTVRFELRNYGAEEKEVTTTTILPDGTEINTFVTVPAENSREEQVTVPRISDGGVGVIRVSDEDLTFDNSFYFQLPQIGAARVLLIDGEPGATTSDSEIYYLERAISPWGGARGGSLPDVVGETGISLLDAEAHRVVFMANIANPAALAPTLTAFVRDGGGLFISLGDNVTAERYNAALTELLPTDLRQLEQLGKRSEKGRSTKIPKAEGLIFQPFQRGGLYGFTQMRFKRVYSVEPFEPTESTRVLLSLDNGMPLLIEHKVGQGRVFLLTTTIDDEWGNFPLQATFLPFIQRCVAYLGGASSSGGQRLSGVVGENVRVSLGDVLSELVIDGPSGPVASTKQGTTVIFKPVTPGPYVIHTNGGPPLAQVAVNTNPDESVLTRPQGLLETAANVEPEAFTKRIVLFPYLLWAAFGFFGLQAWLSWGKEEVSDAVNA